MVSNLLFDSAGQFGYVDMDDGPEASRGLPETDLRDGLEAVGYHQEDLVGESLEREGTGRVL